MASLDILCSNPHNLKNKIRKKNIRKYFAVHQNSWKIFHGINMPKIFHDSTKTLRFPSYILNVWVLRFQLKRDTIRTLCWQATLNAFDLWKIFVYFDVLDLLYLLFLNCRPFRNWQVFYVIFNFCSLQFQYKNVGYYSWTLFLWNLPWTIIFALTFINNF